jgi:membrane protein DedA with SNARE-associated domain
VASKEAVVSVETLVSLLEAHPYLLLFPLVASEGPLATICAGLLVSAGLISWPFAYALAVSADLTADTLYYLLGRSARHPRVGRLLHRLGLRRERLAAMEVSFRRNEATALVAAKVTDVAAAPIFITAGLLKVSYGRFLAWNASVALPKTGFLLFVGFVAGGQALSYAQRLDPGLAILLALLVLVVYLLVSRRLSIRRPGNPRKEPERNGEDPDR